MPICFLIGITIWPVLGHTTSTQANLRLVGGYIVNVRKKTIERRDLFICQGIIVDESIGKKCSPKTLDVSGKWLIPALSDMHVHARGQLGGNDTWKQLLPRDFAKIMARAGVLRFIDAMQDENIIFPSRNAQRSQDKVGEAEIFCAGGAFTPSGGHGFEYLDRGIAKSALHVVDTPKEAISEINAIALKHPDVIKIMYDHRGRDAQGRSIAIKDGEIGVLGKAMSKDVMNSLVKRSKELGLKPYIHIGTWGDAREAILAGAAIINHLGEGPIPKDILSLIAQRKIFWIPTLAATHDFINIKNDQNILHDKLLKKVALPEFINSYKISNYFRNGLYTTDDLYYTAEHQKRHAKTDHDNIKKLLKAGAILVAGSDTPERGTFIGWSLHRELILLVFMGLTTWEALAAATINAGDMIGKKYGIEAGAEGSILVLDSSPISDIWNTTKIRHVIQRGKIIHGI
jgi:imidazolonepropionase-like amidohydrolase